MPAPVTAATPVAPLLSVRDAVFPAHPFSGVLAIGHEQRWRWQQMFPEFAADRHSRISYAQAREGLLQACRYGGADLGLQSGQRKSLPHLGQMAAGMCAQATLEDALRFGLEYQLIAGAMMHLSLEQDAASPQRVALVAHPLFDDPELRDFLEADHLVTAVNAARQLCGQPLPVQQVELRGQQGRSRSLYEAFFGCPVRLGADQSRIVIAHSVLQQRLAAPDMARVQAARLACDAELSAAGLAGRQTLLHQLMALQCEFHNVSHMAAALQMSPRTLQRLLAREGMSYFEITEQVRTGRARRLLQQTGDLEQIAEQLGYSDSRSFRRAFRRWTGLSPAQYRQAVQTGLADCDPASTTGNASALLIHR
ncbi:AraC family transcriptional regulator [Undibacterium griseum]|uniref:AraC family transcriptional regulator ligand-binding domain-containing protein n=1 Tax=Undibacterium griseum TaxID=2762295 RepID=A0ABR6YIF0_9BURK|nr:AraC family transcriptional regulator [Undibacterium griseum]MBC3883638.1 AraC family transcriptional regulator ligand-binding domain-containing protein [Undibacterium griseum]